MKRLRAGISLISANRDDLLECKRLCVCRDCYFVCLQQTHVVESILMESSSPVWLLYVFYFGFWCFKTVPSTGIVGMLHHTLQFSMFKEGRKGKMFNFTKWQKWVSSATARNRLTTDHLGGRWPCQRSVRAVWTVPRWHLSQGYLHTIIVTVLCCGESIRL